MATKEGKIRKELIDTALAAANKPMPARKRGEDETTFLTRLHFAIAGDISDKQWEGLSEEAQDWNNAMADALDHKTEMPSFSDEEPEPEPVAAPAPAAGRRRGTAATTGATGMEKFEPKVGAPVIVTTKRGKTSRGIIVELTDVDIVINEKGEDGEKEADEEFVLANVTIQPQPPALDPKAAVQEEPDENEPPNVGDTVQVTTARDAIKMGVVIEINLEADLLVIKDATGNEQEFSIQRLKNCVVKTRGNVKAAPAVDKGNPPPPTPAPAPAPAASGRRRGAAAAPAPAPAAGGDGDEDGGKVGVGSVIRETLVDNPDASMEDVEKALKKAGVSYRDVTLKVSYKATKQTVDAVLKKHGKK